MILQKNGKTTPSLVASIIERLPDEGDPQRSREETIAKNVAWVVYAGSWWYIANLRRPSDFLSSVGRSQVALIL